MNFSSEIVSVIIPLFNNAEYVRRALNSIFAQTYQGFEIMVVDDGSTDAGPEIVQSYRDPRLRMVHQENEGPGAARNRGLRETAAPYVMFLDADDELMPDFISTYIEALKSNPDCDYVVGPYLQGDYQFDRSETWRKYGIEEGAWRLPENVSHADLHCFLTMLHWTCTILCKRDIVEKYGGFYSKGKCKYGEDRYLHLQMLLNHKIFRIMRPLAWYHSETSGISSIGSGPRPLIPILTDPEPIRMHCPQIFCEILEQYLAIHALGYAMEYTDANDVSTALSLVRQFPLIKKYRKKYAKLQIKIAHASFQGFFKFSGKK